MLGWGVAGLIVGILVNVLLFTSGEVGAGTSAFVGLCLCSPTFWGITIPAMIVGMIIGAVHAEIVKSRMKSREWEKELERRKAKASRLLEDDDGEGSID